MYPIRYDAAHIEAQRNALHGVMQQLRSLCDELEASYRRLEAVCPKENFLTALRSNIRGAQALLEKTSCLERLLLEMENIFEATSREVDDLLQDLACENQAAVHIYRMGVSIPTYFAPAIPLHGLSNVLLAPTWLEDALERELGEM